MTLSSEIDFIILLIHLIVGFVLVYFAVKAYKKTRYFPMALLAIGFILIVLGETFMGNLFGVFGPHIAEIIEELFEIVGFIVIIIAIKRS